MEAEGDAWMAECGVSTEDPEHAAKMARFALEVLSNQDTIREIFNDSSLSIRIGIACGPVVSKSAQGVDSAPSHLYDEVVHMAGLMESTGLPGCVQITQDMQLALQNSPTTFRAFARSTIQLKGKSAQKVYILTQEYLGSEEKTDRFYLESTKRKYRHERKSYDDIFMSKDLISQCKSDPYVTFGMKSKDKNLACIHGQGSSVSKISSPIDDAVEKNVIKSIFSEVLEVEDLPRSASNPIRPERKSNNLVHDKVIGFFTPK
eukprot:CAMPEP_0196601630 /NCGR_PEP_ID=MMETSP1081-20130531/96004_1 /TAXON_ID=36882 /ORGANISM="Pyramimonas amylifera, Strain CCMP720" /LENGTH=260 /DNA_ID=CAMNT_0041927513 /DNA_START=1007 /DNA_END=1789 /DNA_ORIENTATION=+